MFKAFFEAIQFLFVDILFKPLDLLRHLELKSWYGWWISNGVSWILMGICAYYTVYWIKQLQLHKENGEENQDTTAHSFLNK
ncbi:DUF6341 family protein [Flavobacterium pallidum]|uniref:Uracil phosphoribosyltransferase n=1 Tax=Flavobacterium pallidum TaxID=2172098 RepID=A0A2S1SL90_9FLAO|nr:uracil phosphoribosyltransferase [Flavobacterium pallidum]AWI27173.1 uracil phosphoribosyltransferase [Flavobacterium pallidum]